MKQTTTLQTLIDAKSKEFEKQFCDTDGDILIEGFGDYKSSSGNLLAFLSQAITQGYEEGYKLGLDHATEDCIKEVKRFIKNSKQL